MKRFLVILFLMILAIAGYGMYRYYMFDKFKKTPVTISLPVLLVVEKGDTWATVAKRLAEKGVISDQKSFSYLVRLEKADTKLKTGEFELEGKLTPGDVINRIVSGKVKYYTFTVPEGYNKYDLAKLFDSLDWIGNHTHFLALCDDPVFWKHLGAGDVKSCEGLLFPSTYHFPRGVLLKDVLKFMDNKMQKILAKYKTKIKESGFTPYQVLILASVIEKETGIRNEQPVIASVFLNRLSSDATGKKLQSDPTVIYGMLPDFNGNLTKNDLITDSPYNTYTRAGLPAAPICFPGESAIKAVLEPEKTNYLYFVAENNGRHYFSPTYAEHAAAVTHYQVNGKTTPFNYKNKKKR